MLLSLFFLEREKENNKLHYHHIISMVHTLWTSQRAKKCLLSHKKIVFGALLNQQKIRYFNLLGLAFSFMRHYT